MTSTPGSGPSPEPIGPGTWSTLRRPAIPACRGWSSTPTTTPANVHEAVRTGAIHEALSEAGLAPSEHLVDAVYVSAEQLVVATARHGIDLIGPTR